MGLEVSALTADLVQDGIAVLVVEDHALLAQSLVIALNAEGCRADMAEVIDRRSARSDPAWSCSTWTWASSVTASTW